MQEATWNDIILAESDKTVRLEGNHYFPLDSLNQEYFQESDQQTVCPWMEIKKLIESWSVSNR